MKNIARKALVRMGSGLVAFFLIIIWNLGFIKSVYFEGQVTTLGLTLNGVIFILFLLGIIKLCMGFIHYASEEKQLDIFIKGKARGELDLFDGLSPNSIIYNRYFKIKELFDKKVPINHGAITSIMLSEESLYLSFPKFVNNILILTGVFGTIISLLLALAGAGSILETGASGEGVGLILHGMNTALNTTLTAIVCFSFYTYFFHKLTDVQTHFFGRIEEAVLIYIVPEFAFDSETVNYHTEKMIKELTGMAAEIRKLSEGITVSIAKIPDHMDSQKITIDATLSLQSAQLEKTNRTVVMLEKIKDILKEGFRLS